MFLRLARFTLLSVLITPASYAKDANHRDGCRQLMPDSSPVKNFYEENPTYIDPGVDLTAFKTGTPESQGMRTDLLEQGTAKLSSLPQPLSFLVLKNGVLVYEKYFKGSQVTHSNNIHSSSKTLLSGLVGIAIREGFITSVDQKISDILSPKFYMKNSRKSIAVRHLLTMSAGLDWTEDSTEYDIELTPNWVQGILNLRLAQSVGAGFNYDTGLTHLLSAIITESSGMDTCSFAEKYLFDPMDITIKHWGKDPQGYYSGGYNLYLTARDLAKVGQMYLQKGEWNGKSIVPADYIAAATQPGIPSDHPEYTYGYLWWLMNDSGRAIYKMWGYGGQFVYIVPDLNLVFVTTADTKNEYTELDGDHFLLNYVIPAATNKKKSRSH